LLLILKTCFRHLRRDIDSRIFFTYLTSFSWKIFLIALDTIAVCSVGYIPLISLGNETKTKKTPPRNGSRSNKMLGNEAWLFCDSLISCNNIYKKQNNKLLK